MLNFKPVDRSNLDAVIALQVAGPQRHFVAPNVASMAQAAVMPECVPVAAFDGDEPVGFMMYVLCDEDDGECWLYRLMVDERHQGKGYGRALMTELLRRVQAAPEHRRLFLGVEPENTGAIALYRQFGFAFDGRAFGGERTMVLAW